MSCDSALIYVLVFRFYILDIQVAQNHKESLEIISVAGCTISLLAVLITIVVTLSFWRVLKSPRAHVLLNLCAAIAATCALSILERAARNMVCIVCVCLKRLRLNDTWAHPSVIQTTQSKSNESVSRKLPRRSLPWCFHGHLCPNTPLLDNNKYWQPWFKKFGNLKVYCQNFLL